MEVGGKLQNFAIAVMIIGCLCSIGVAIYFWVGKLVFLGFVMFIVGPLGSWITCLLLYGFGELIIQTTNIAINTRSQMSSFNNLKNEIKNNSTNQSQTSQKNEIKTKTTNQSSSKPETRIFNTNTKPHIQPPRTNKLECPSCFSKIDSNATECPHCGRIFR